MTTPEKAARDLVYAAYAVRNALGEAEAAINKLQGCMKSIEETIGACVVAVFTMSFFVLCALAFTFLLHTW